MSDNKNVKIIVIFLVALYAAGCTQKGEPTPRLSMFVGIDISGSFVNSGHYENSISYLANYIYASVNGLDEFEVPNVLYVSSIGGNEPGESKTFYPKEIFENKSVEDIETQLMEIYPKDALDNITDFNSFFEHIGRTIENNNLVLRPVSVILLSDGIPDVKRDGETDFKSIDLSPLEKLSRNVTIRLLYTDAITGRAWQTEVPRRRVKIWTQDATVMATWSDSTIYLKNKRIEEQDRWMNWTKNNVNYNVRARRVD